MIGPPRSLAPCAGGDDDGTSPPTVCRQHFPGLGARRRNQGAWMGLTDGQYRVLAAGDTKLADRMRAAAGLHMDMRDNTELGRAAELSDRVTILDRGWRRYQGAQFGRTWLDRSVPSMARMIVSPVCSPACRGGGVGEPPGPPPAAPRQGGRPCHRAAPPYSTMASRKLATGPAAATMARWPTGLADVGVAAHGTPRRPLRPRRGIPGSCHTFSHSRRAAACRSSTPCHGYRPRI